MNEQQPEEFYVLEEQQAIRELVTATAERPCALIVGGKWGAGGRACNHAASEHTGSIEGGDRMCRGCEREGVPMSRYRGLERIWPGRDHDFTLPHRPTPAVETEERAAA